jgi:hypothetical protein
MTSGRAYGLMSAISASLLLCAGLPERSMASEESEKALKEQMRLMQQQMEDLKKEVQALRHEQQPAPGSNAPAKPPATPAPSVAAAPATKEAPGPTAKTAKETPKEPLFEKFLKGFYGTLDVSFDDVSKGIKGLNAYSYSLVDPTNPNSGYVQGGAKSGPVGRLGYLPSFSTNKSQIG